MAKKRRYKEEVESDLEKAFYVKWEELFPDKMPALQYRFHPTRKFRFDFAWPMSKVAVEVMGMGPGHCGRAAMTKDYDRHLEALFLNWKIVYFTSLHLKQNTIVPSLNKVARLLKIPPAVSFRSGYIPLSERRRR